MLSVEEGTRAGEGQRASGPPAEMELVVEGRVVRRGGSGAALRLLRPGVGGV